MGNYKICVFCDNLHEGPHKQMCRSCEVNYDKVRSFVLAKPDSIVLEISNQTGISVSRILSFVKNGYFIIKEGSLDTKQ